MTGWPRTRLQPLPRTLPPVTDETLTSYLARLAHANHISVPDLRIHLDPARSPITKKARTSPAALAAATGRSQLAVSYALPELRTNHPAPETLALRGRTLPRPPNKTRPACRRCMTANDIHRPVMTWMRHDQNVCRQHKLWIGPGTHHPENQPDLTTLPEIVDAQRRHAALIRRYGRRRVQESFHLAHLVCTDWAHGGTNTRADHTRRHQQLENQAQRHITDVAARSAAQYPEVVALTAIFAWAQARA